MLLNLAYINISDVYHSRALIGSKWPKSSEFGKESNKGSQGDVEDNQTPNLVFNPLYEPLDSSSSEE